MSTTSSTTYRTTDTLPDHPGHDSCDDGMLVRDETVPGPHGPVPIRVYEPTTHPVAGLVWSHGGAFQHGDLDVPEADWVSRCLARAGILTVSVDYRLAVGDVFFPIPCDDVLAVWSWATSTGRGRVQTGRWHVGGGSAGGNLAASITLQARDGLAPLPATSVLVYPVLHSVLPVPSPELAALLDTLPDDARFTPERTRELNLAYVGEERLLTHPYAFPAHGELAGLPPTFVLTSDVDDLRPSGETYAAALALAGVDVSLVREPGVRHGHLNDPELLAAQRTVQRIVDWIRSSTI